MAYKAKREQEQRELEDRLSAEQTFSGKALTTEEAHIIEEKGTEAANTGEYTDFAPKRGYFACRKCGRPIYSFEAKFKSGCGWPAFDKCYANAIVTRLEDDGTDRVELSCSGCGGHLGHVFVEGSHAARTEQRHCANSRALQYIKHDPPAGSLEVQLNVAFDKDTSKTVLTEGATPNGASAAAAIDLGALDRLATRLERSADRLLCPAAPAAAPAAGSPAAPAASDVDVARLERVLARLEAATRKLGV